MFVDVFEQLVDFGMSQVQAIPQQFGFATDQFVLLDFVPCLERWFLVSLWPAESAVGNQLNVKL